MVWHIASDPLIVVYAIGLTVSIAFLIWFLRWTKSYLAAWDQACRESPTEYTFYSPGGGRAFKFMIREIFSIPPGWLIDKKKIIKIVLLMSIALFLEGLSISYILQQTQNVNYAARFDLPQIDVLTDQSYDSRLYLITSGVISAIFPLLSFPILFLSSRVRRSARRAAVHSMVEVRTKDTRPPFLFLRSFYDDQVSLTQDEAGNMFQRVLARGSFFANVDELLTERYWHIGPVIAIGKPGEALPPLGAARAYLSGESWQTVVADLMKEARAIILALDYTEGVTWELRNARECGWLEKALLLIPPHRYGDTELILHTLAVLGFDGEKLHDMTGAVIAILPISDNYLVVCCSNRADSYAYDFVMRVGLHAILEDRQRLLELH